MISSWLLLALVAGIFSNLSNFFNRYLLKDGDDSTVYAWFFEFSRFIVFGIFAFFDFHIVFSLHAIISLVLMGIVEFLAVFLYMKMHAYSHLSISTIIGRTRLIWIPLISFFFLGEHLSSSVYIGMLILFLGLAIATSPHKLFVDKGLWYAYVSAFIISINAVQIKLNTSFASPALLIVFLSFPTTVGFPLIIRKPKRFLLFFKKNLWTKLLGALCNVLSIYFFAVAVKIGPVSIVNMLYQATIIFSVLAGIFVLNEREDTKRKLVGTIVALVGIIISGLL